MILSDKTIIKMLNDGTLKISPLDKPNTTRQRGFQAWRYL